LSDDADPFDFYRRPQGFGMPQTAATALKAMRQEDLGPEAFVFLATSVTGVNLEPADTVTLYQMVSTSGLSISVNSFLSRIFQYMLSSSRSEDVQMASESLSRLEKRFISGFESLKVLLENETPGTVSWIRARLAQIVLHYKYAIIQEGNSVVSQFYLEMTLTMLDQTVEQGLSDRRALMLRALCLHRLGRYEEALVDCGHPLIADRVEALFLRASTLFSLRRLDECQATLALLAQPHYLPRLSIERRNTVMEWKQYE